MNAVPAHRSLLHRVSLWLASRGAPDPWLVLLAMPLLGIGLVFVFSASYPIAGFEHSRLTRGDSYYFLKHQALSLAVGLPLMWAVSLLPLKWVKDRAYSGYWAAIFLLLAVLVFGKEINGARRWLCGIQPSEFARLLAVAAAARLIVDKQDQVRQLPVMMRMCMLGVPLIMLVIVEPHFAGAVLFAGVLFAMLHIGGARRRHLGLVIVAALALGAALILSSPYRWTRVKQMFEGHYHRLHCQMAFGAGGLGGRGFGESREKYFYLPEPHTDSILAIIGEEMGFFATVGVIALFGLVVWRIFRIASRASDEFAVLVASGVALTIGFEALINIASVTGLGLTTGLPLPLVSYGGSSMWSTLAGIGLVLGVSREQREAAPVRARGSGAARVLRINEIGAA